MSGHIPVSHVRAGLYGKKYATNFSDYLTAGKQSTVLMVMGTAIGAHIGSGFIIGGAESAVLDGYGGVWYALGCAASYLVVPATIARLVQRKGYVTLSDYFKERYQTIDIRLVYSVVTSLAWLGIIGRADCRRQSYFSRGFGYNGALGAVVTTLVVLFTPLCPDCGEPMSLPSSSPPLSHWVWWAPRSMY